MNVALVALAVFFASLVVVFESLPGLRRQRGRCGTRASFIFAYECTTLAANAHLTVIGFVAWFAPRAAVAAATGTDYTSRLGLEIPIVRDSLLDMLAAHLVTDLACYVSIPELREPLFLVHHILVGTLLLMAESPAYCHHYIAFFAGVAELSNLPLAYVELCTLVPSLKRTDRRVYEVAKVLFGVSFIGVRILYWPLVCSHFWVDSLRALAATHPPGKPSVVVAFLVANAVLTAIQFKWGLRICRTVLPPPPKQGSSAAIGTGKWLGPMYIASDQHRMQTLWQLERSRPRLVGLYRASCWMYSLLGIIYWGTLPYLPPDFQQTALMGGKPFAVCLLLQGLLSYINDALCTFGHSPPGPPKMWNVFDRTMAITLTAVSVLTSGAWASSTQGRAPSWLGSALCCSFLFFLPSRVCEISGRMTAFLILHSLWHYLPCAFAALWMVTCAVLNQ